MENEIFNFKEELRMQMLWSLAAIKEGMVEFFNSEDNSSSEEEFVKKVNTVETSKGGGELVGKDCHGVMELLLLTS